MKLLYLIAFLSLAYSNTSAQLFTVQQSTIRSKSKKDFKRSTSGFYEDENYVVRKTCMGEWGGTVIFRNKKTGTEYYCAATCPVAVNKINGKYIVTNTLAHLMGISEVIQIDHPDSMTVLKPGKKRGTVSDTVFSTGSIRLLDTSRILMLTSFPYEGELYYINTDIKKTYISKIENKKLINVGLVAEESIWAYEPELIHTTDNHYVVFFNNRKKKGYIDISGNKIEPVWFK